MAKQAVVDVLNATLGRFVKNIDVESLSLGIWSGRVEFPKGLELNADSINRELLSLGASSASSVKVVSGTIEKVLLEVPWRALASKPVVLKLSGVNLVLSPAHQCGNEKVLTPSGAPENSRKDVDGDSTAITDRRKAIEEQDEARIRNDALVQALMQENEVGDVDKKQERSEDKTNETFKDRLVRRIVENIQVEITGVHAQFRESATVGRPGFSTGFVLDTLSIDTTDDKGNHVFVDRVPGNFLYKALHLKGFGIYLDEIGTSGSGNKNSHSYVLSPLPFEGNLRQSDKAPSSGSDDPKYLVTSHLPLLSITLTRQQLELANVVASALEPQGPQPLFPQYRPTAPISSSTAKEWWRYAVRCIGRLSGRNNWPEFMDTFKKRRTYVALYKRSHYHAKCRWLKKLSPDEENELQQIEDDRSISVDGIVMWRAMADAQVKLEQEKRHSKTKKKTGEGKAGSDPNATLLTVDDIKALERQLEQASESSSSLAGDLSVMEVKFTLGSFKLKLVSKAKALMQLGLGKIDASLSTKASGARIIRIGLASLQVDDLVTHDTIFPAVLRRNLSKNAAKQSSDDVAFSLELGQLKNGDQSLKLKMVCLELVASPLLLKEIKKFFTLSPSSRDKSQPTIDGEMFYDAQEECTTPPLSVLADETAAAVSESVSSALIEAWNDKKQSQTKWIVDCEIDAPLVVVPESCSDAAACCIIFDLGHLFFVSTTVLTPPIKEWFSSRTDKKTGLSKIESYNLGVTNLVFFTGTAGDRDFNFNPNGADNGPDDSTLCEAILGPFSLTLDVGLDTSNFDSTRICVDASLPKLDVQISPSQVSTIVSVASRWEGYLQDASLGDASKPANAPNTNDAKSTEEFRSSIKRLSMHQAGQRAGPRDAKDEECFHAAIALQKLALTVKSGRDDDSFAAHLVRVQFSCSSFSSGALCTRLRMGFFWIIEQTGVAQRPTLLAQSRIPQSLVRSKGQQQDKAMQTFQQLGVFDANSKETADGADLSFTSKEMSTHVNVMFTSLMLDWHISAVEKLLAIQDDISNRLASNGSSAHGDNGPWSNDLMKPGASSAPTEGGDLTASVSSRKTVFYSATEHTLAPTPSFIISAQMTSLIVSFHPRDDTATIFRFTMSQTKASMKSQGEESTDASIDIGDLRVESLAEGVLSDYRTILGLAPDTTTSLFSAKYSKGLAVMDSDLAGAHQCDACASVDLSSMKFVYLHSQLFSLKDYLTEGVLGSLTSRAAASASSTAQEVAQSVAGQQLFQFTAAGFDVVLPETERDTDFFVTQIGEVTLRHESFPDSSGKSSLDLLGLSIKCHDGTRIVPDAIQMAVTVTSSPGDTKRQIQASTHGNLKVSKASFFVSQSQITQMVNTLHGNLSQTGETTNSVTSDSEGDQSHDTKEEEGGSESSGGNITADLEFVGMAFYLCDKDADDAIFCLKAEESHLKVASLYPENKQYADLKLRNLEIEDVRNKSTNRSFRHFMSHNDVDGEGDIFQFHVTQNKDGTMNADMKLDSLQMVLLPGLVMDAMNTVSKALDCAKKVSSPPPFEDHATNNQGKDKDQDQSSPETKKITFSFCANKCRGLLTDLDFRPSEEQSECAVFVFQGDVQVSADAQMCASTGSIVKSSLLLDEKQFQFYAAHGVNLLRPMQILEPTSFSISAKYSEDQGSCASSIEVTAACVSSADVTLTTQDVSHLGKTISSMTNAVAATNKPAKPSSEEEKEQIMALAVSMDTTEDAESNGAPAADADGLSVSGKENTRTKDGGASTDAISSERAREVSDIRLSFSMPVGSLLFVNDYRGLDQPLFLAKGKDVTFGGNFHISRVKGRKSAEASFDSRLHISLLSDYFDTLSNRWEPLLSDPLEIDLSATREKDKRAELGGRMASTLDIHAKNSALSLTEQFVASVNAASRTMAEAPTDEENCSRASRTLISGKPSAYCLSNLSGSDVRYEIDGSPPTVCKSGEATYLSFKTSSLKGVGGRRVYGQDVVKPKTLKVSIVDDSTGGAETANAITVKNIDEEVDFLRIHRISDGQKIFSEVLNTGRLKVMLVRSQVVLHNCTKCSLSLALKGNDHLSNIGICNRMRTARSPKFLYENTGSIALSSDPYFDSVRYPSMGISSRGLGQFLAGSNPEESWSLLFRTVDGDSGERKGSDDDSWGIIRIPTMLELTKLCPDDYNMTTYDLVMSSSASDDPHFLQSSTGDAPDNFAVQVTTKVTRIKSDFLLDVYVQPRLILWNQLPISIFVRTPSKHVYGADSGYASKDQEKYPDQFIHHLLPSNGLHVHSTDDTIDISFRCADQPVSGGETGWLHGGFIGIPLGRKEIISQPIPCRLPMVNGSGFGSEVCLSEVRTEHYVSPKDGSEKSSWHASTSVSAVEQVRAIYMDITNIAVDHTGNGQLVFETIDHEKKKSSMRGSGMSTTTESITGLSAFSPHRNTRKRISLLAQSKVPFCLIEQSSASTFKSRPIQIDDLSLRGGIQSNTVFWEDGSTSGYFAYRKPAGSSDNTSAVHIIPEYVVFNGSVNTLVIDQSMNQQGANEVSLNAGNVTPIKCDQQKKTLKIVIKVVEVDGVAGPVSVEKVGMLVCPIRRGDDIVGSLAVQTVVGGEDAHLVVKIGNMEVGRSTAEEKMSFFAEKEDLLRFRIRYDFFQVTLIDTKRSKIEVGPVTTKDTASGSKVLLLQDGSAESEKEQNAELSELRMSVAHELRSEVTSIQCSRLTLDFQRIFMTADNKDHKRKVERTGSAERETELSRLALIVREFSIRDCDPSSPNPVVFASSSDKKFFDLAVLLRGPLDADIVQVHMIDLNIVSESQSKSESDSGGKLVIDTNESFVWRVIDVMNRISVGSEDSNDADGGFEAEDKADADESYSPPRSNRICNFRAVRISPFTLEVSFVRHPEASRYKEFHDVRGAQLMNYLTRQLKFSLRNANLFFAEYYQTNVKGPPDQLISYIDEVYISRLKFKWLKIVSAVSIDDWATLAGRNDEEDKFVYGDLSRTAGMVAGLSVGYVFTAAGHVIGNTVQTATEAVGLGAVGAGANKVISGIGSGAGAVAAGAGKGAGQLLGGVEGGLTRAGQGLVGGIKRGSVGGFARGVTEAVDATAAGTSHGVTAFARGTVSGVRNLCDGLFAGIDSVGTSIGGSLFGGRVEVSQDPHFQSHRARWTNISVLSLAIMANAAMWTTFFSIPNSASSYFFEGGGDRHRSGGESSGDALGLLETLALSLVLVYPLMYCPGSIWTGYSIRRFGAREAILIGAFLTEVGGATRWGGSFVPPKSVGRFLVTLLGQILAGLGHPFLMNSIGLMAANWFEPNERDVAVTFGSVAAVLGVVVGQEIPFVVAIIANGDPIARLSWALLLNFVLSTIALALAWLCTKSAPPDAPSRSTALRDSYRQRQIRIHLQSITPYHVEGSNLSVPQGSSISDDSATYNTNNGDAISLSTATRDAWKEVRRQLDVLQDDKPFMNLLFSFGLGPVVIFEFAFGSSEAFLKVCGYNGDARNISLAIFVGSGIVGAVMASVAMSRRHRYAQLVKLGSLLVVGSIFLLSFELRRGNEPGVFVSFGVLGFVSVPLFPVFMQNVLECTYPISEDLSTGFLLTVGYAVFGVPIALVFRALALWGTAECEPTSAGVRSWMTAKNFLVVTSTVSMIIACNYKGESKRTKHDSIRRGSEEEPLLAEGEP